MIRLWIISIAATLCVVMYSHAQTPVDIIETWTNSDTAGWTNNPSQTTLLNPGGYLNMQFPGQSSPSNQSDIMYVDLPSEILFTNISFGFFSADVSPSSVRLCMHSTNGNLWCVILPGPFQGQWTPYDVPVDFSQANWSVGPDSSADQFRSDMLSVDWVGVYIVRHSEVSAQNYGIKHFEMQGVTIPGSVSISGTIRYAGDQGGPIYVSAFGSPMGSITTTLAGAGSYRLTGLPLATDNTISAYRDSNNDNTQEFWEATGSWTGNTARVYITDLARVDITMSDPMTWDGLPYWWVLQYFPTWQIGSLESLATMDSDGNGMSNYAKYLAGVDPTDFLSVFSVDIENVDMGNGVMGILIGWNSISNRTYDVWRTADLTLGFTKTVSGIAATPPRNEYEDPDATNGTNYFYRVQVE